MRDIFAITNFIDSARWSNIENYSIINYANPDLSFPKKILTHYLTYVADRQMPFQRIWNVGGFVFSRLVEDYTTNQNISISKLYTDYIEVAESGDVITSATSKLSFKCSLDNLQLTALQQEKLQSSIRDGNVVFRSRFVTTDFCSIYCTLYILECIANRSLIDYIKKVIQLHINANTNEIRKEYKDEIVKRIAFSFYVLTYQGNNTKSNKQTLLEYINSVQNKAKTQKENVENTLSSLEKFNKAYYEFRKDKIYSCKRVWCALRDYMKGLEFKDFFAKEMKDLLGDNIGNIFYLKQLELPGDVWNNNDKFISCNFPNKDHDRTFNNYLRETFKNQENNINEGYVEQFDITFSLVPRMCERKLCALCPYGILKDKEHQFNLLCINDVSKLCPIILHSTGYIFKCIGKERCILCSLR